MKTRKLWLGLGAAALTSTIPNHIPQAEASPAALDAATASTLCRAPSQVIRVADGHAHGADVKAGAGGEGGEGSAAQMDADARLDPMVRFYRDVQLVRGHIRVGNELIKAGLWTEALPHFLHPVEELYDKLAPHIKVLKLKPFKQQLNALAQTVKAKNAPAYDEALKALEGRLASVDSGMKAETKNWMPFVVQTALETMRSAIGEYEESIEDGKFAKAVEYQDSRGFVFQGESLLQSVGPDLAAKYPQDSAAALAAIATLKSGWPAPLPPAAPVLDVASVKAAVSKIELALGSVK